MYFWTGSGSKIKILNMFFLIVSPCIADFVFSCQKGKEVSYKSTILFLKQINQGVNSEFNADFDVKKFIRNFLRN